MKKTFFIIGLLIFFTYGCNKAKDSEKNLTPQEEQERVTPASELNPAEAEKAQGTGQTMGSGSNPSDDAQMMEENIDEIEEDMEYNEELDEEQRMEDIDIEEENY